MSRFRIERRAPGDPLSAEVPWEALGSVEASTVDAALAAFFHGQGWYTSHVLHGRGVVNGVGHFRAVPAQVEPQHRFMVQRQDAPAHDARHRTWVDVGVVEAATAGAALDDFVEHMRWQYLGRHDNGGVIAGIGPVRAVPVDRADEHRVVPAPPLDR